MNLPTTLISKQKDILKEALKAFDGTLILVSHDRDFLDGLATKVFEFGNKRIKEHFEDINEFPSHEEAGESERCGAEIV